MDRQPGIVVVGGGVAGLEIATSLGRRWRRHRASPSVTLVDRDSAHVWKPMLHTIAAGTRDISQQQTPYIAQAHDAGFMFQPGQLAAWTARRARCALPRCMHPMAACSCPRDRCPTTPW